jgi:hypothetical protein
MSSLIENYLQVQDPSNKMSHNIIRTVWNWIIICAVLISFQVLMNLCCGICSNGSESKFQKPRVREKPADYAWRRKWGYIPPGYDPPPPGSLLVIAVTTFIWALTRLQQPQYISEPSLCAATLAPFAMTVVNCIESLPDPEVRFL